MSLAPLIFRDLWNYGWVRPFRLLDHQLGMTGHYYPFIKNALDNIESVANVTTEKDKFQVTIDVRQFAPNEITVKTVNDNTLVVEAKHESKKESEGQQGYIFKHFTRRYVLPPGHDISKIVSNLTADGVLTVTAPRIETDTKKVNEKIVPINQIPK